jgi:type I restriction enzyme S subunit
MTTTVADLIAADVLTMSDGYRTKRSEHASSGFRILRVADVLNDHVRLDGPDFVSSDFAKAIGVKAAQAGDVLLTTKGTVGRVAVMPPTDEAVVYSPQLCFFRVRDASRLDPRWLSYWFRSGDFMRQASHRKDNTDMAAYINLADIRSLSFDLPSIHEQRGIAEVLGALDDKIAANTQSVNLALELADAEYSQRVRGATPGQTFGEVATVGGGGTPRTSNEDYWNGDVSWATPTDVTALSAPYLTTTARMVSEAGLANCSSALYPAGSILMTSRATIGAFALAQRPTAVNQGFIVVNAHDAALQMWLFHEMRARISEFISHANGATFLELSRGKFKAFTVRVAESQVMADFGVFAEALHEQAAALTAESDRLAATRDALLPLLMSGKVKVKDAESVVGEVL